MFTKLIGLIVLILGIYLLAVFVTPDLADTYGSKDLNLHIRHIKDASLRFASGSDTPGTLWNKMRTTAEPIITDVKKTSDNITKKVDTGIKTVETTVQTISGTYHTAEQTYNTAKNLFSGSNN